MSRSQVFVVGGLLVTQVLESYTGKYQFETLDNRIFAITHEGDKLFMISPKGTKTERFAESVSTFFRKIRPMC